MIFMQYVLWMLHSVSVGIFFILINISDEFPTTPKSVNSTENEISVPVVQPMAIEDGQTVTERLRVMRALAGIERRMEEVHGLPQPPWSTMEINYLYEMDIVLTPSQAEAIYEHGKLRQKRKMSADHVHYWQLPIFYLFDGSHSHAEQEDIREAIRYWESLTCLRFHETSGLLTEIESNKNNLTLLFTRTEGCWSFVGRLINEKKSVKVQKVAAADDCLDDFTSDQQLRSFTDEKSQETDLYSAQRKGSLAHEIGHVIGFWHEHSRPDRDEHVNINWREIKSGASKNFQKKTWEDIMVRGVPYDVGSAMHYSSMAYASGRVPTVKTKEFALQRALGQRHELTFYDVKLANLAYCSDVCNGISLERPCLHGGYQDPKNCHVCRCPEGLYGDYCETVAPSVGVSCSMEIDVTENAIDIDHTQGFLPGQQCNWYLKSPQHTNIHFTFVDNFMEYNPCYQNPYYACLNFVEVRYDLDLANTGARFCCSQDLGSRHLVSKGNEMLVLLRVYTEGTRGFKAKVWSEFCGGCSAQKNVTEYRPCYESESYQCRRSWKNRSWLPCSSWFSWRTKGNCNKWLMKEQFRTDTCYRTVAKCCNGFKLNGTKCVADVNVKPTAAASTEVDIKVDPTTEHVSQVTKRDTGTTGWTTWSSYSECSPSCGGCGSRTRNRTCGDPNGCGGKANEIETVACSDQQPCVSVVQTTCQKTETKKYMCGFSICTKLVTTEYTCDKLECCAGYTIVDGVCRKS